MFFEFLVFSLSHPVFFCFNRVCSILFSTIISINICRAIYVYKMVKTIKIERNFVDSRRFLFIFIHFIADVWNLFTRFFFENSKVFGFVVCVLAWNLYARGEFLCCPTMLLVNLSSGTYFYFTYFFRWKFMNTRSILSMNLQFSLENAVWNFWSFQLFCAVAHPKVYIYICVMTYTRMYLAGSRVVGALPKSETIQTNSIRCDKLSEIFHRNVMPLSLLLSVHYSTIFVVVEVKLVLLNTLKWMDTLSCTWYRS